MSLSYGYGGALTGLGVVGLCACNSPLASRCLLITVMQICYLLVMGKHSTLVIMAHKEKGYELKSVYRSDNFLKASRRMHGQTSGSDFA